MNKVIVIVGAGPGLGLGVARHYGRLGYRVALLSRNLDKLRALEARLGEEDIEARSFHIDLAQTDRIDATFGLVREVFGRIDAVHYAPNTNGGFLPAADLKPDQVRQDLDILFVGLVAVVQAVLPEFRNRGEGLILAGFGGSAATPMPFLSGPGPGMAAARNYLSGLQAELAPENIKVGIITVSAIIRASAVHQAIEAGHIQLGGPGMTIPDVDSDHLAALLAEAAEDPERVEARYP